MEPGGLSDLLREVRACEACAAELPLGPRPVLRAAPEARILVVGQAPGRRVHASGVPWDDPSGRRLRDWLGVDAATFYDERRFAIVPMGFCYPGTGRAGDLPPRPECAELWHARLLAHLPRIELTLLLSRFAIDRYIGPARGATLADVARDWRRYAPARLPMPHPSPRNNRWLGRNPWFEAEVVPYLRRQVRRILAG